MSYILDALNRSEANRSGASQTDIPKYARTTPSPAQDSRRGLYGLLVAGLCIFGLIMYLWLNGTTKQTKSADVVHISEVSPAKESLWMHRQLAPAAIKPSPPVLSKPVAIAQPKQMEQLQAVDRKQRITIAELEAESTSNIPEFSDTPTSVQDALSSLTIEGHIYDLQPSRRMMIISGQLRHEKQSTSNGLKVEEITEDGAILSYRDTTFHLSIFAQ